MNRAVVVLTMTTASVVATVMVSSAHFTAPARIPARAPASTRGSGFASVPVCVASRQPVDATSVDNDGARARNAFVVAAGGCMTAMHTGMARAFDAQRSADGIFAAAMVPHHQGAIDMARQLLLYGKDPELRAVALGVIAEQQAEVEMLRVWIARHPEAASPTGVRAAATTASRAPREKAHGIELAMPPSGQGIAISAHDRVYTADQVSNTVSVIDPSSNRLVGQLRLGSQRLTPLPAATFVLSPLYGGEANVHGLGFSPDHRLLNVVSTMTNAVTLVETATNRVRGTVYVGRNPHEGFFRPDGKELWVAVRGENYLSVIDPTAMREVRRITTAPGPSMVVFRPDGRVAFVNHSFTAELDVVDVAGGRVVKRIPVVSPFSPDLVVSADGSQLWMTHKDVGKVTVVNARTYVVEGVIDTGPITNHVTLAGPGGGTRVGGASAGAFAYVSVCGENAVKVYRRDRTPVTAIPVGACPHGVWASGDGTRVYVGLQEGDGVDVIDTRTNRKIAEIPMGQSPQALVYVPNAVPTGAGASGLVPLATQRRPIRLELLGSSPDGAPRGTVDIRSLGPVDGLDVSVTGLEPGATYTLYISGGRGEMPGEGWPLATVVADGRGAAPLVEAVSAGRLPITDGALSGGRRVVPVKGADALGPIVAASRR